jgi:phosphate transport system substrate-binding protein
MVNRRVWFEKSIGILFILTLLLTGCNPANPPQESAASGNITISGAFALYPMMVSWAEEYQKVNPGVTFDVSAGGAGKGMADTLSGVVDIGMVSREIKPEETSQGAFGIGVTKDAVFLTVNAANPYIDRLLQQGVTRETLQKIFISGEFTTWGQVLGDDQISDEIHVFTRSDSCGAAEVWSKYLGGAAQEDLLGVGVSGDPGLLDAVIMDVMGIGYNNLGYAYDPTSGLPVQGAVVLPIDNNGNGQIEADEYYETHQEASQAVADGIYPSPPARVLYLVTNGAPTGIVKDFIVWVLNDGQQFIDAAGYVQLPAADLAAERDKLK